MKKLLLVSFIAFFGFSFAFAQGGGQRRSPEERLKAEIDQMTEAIGLDKAQVEKITPLVKASQEKQTELFTKMRESGGQPDFEKMRADREKITQELDTKISAVISKQQLIKLQEFRKTQEEQRRARMQNRN